MNPTISQQKAIDCVWPQVLVAAGPGSGKTSTLAARINRLLDGGVAPADIVAVTYTNAAATVLASRIKARIGHVGTLHSWMLRRIRGLNPGKTITPLPEGADKDMMMSFMDRHRCKESFAHMMKLKERGMAWFTKRAEDRDLNGLDEVVVMDYFQSLMRAGALDFDMILQLGLASFADGQAHPKHLLVDEIQDAAHIDLDIYDAINAETKFYVGDPSQSIYAFREKHTGAMDVISRLVARGIPTMALEENFRCASKICSLADAIIERHNPKRVIKKNNLPIASSGEGEVVMRSLGAMAEAGGAVVALCEAAMKSGQSCAVLCRTNWLAEKFTEALGQWGIDSQVKRESRTPKDWSLLCAVVACAADPENPILAMNLMQCRRITNESCWEVRALAEKDGKPILAVAEPEHYESMKKPGFFDRMGNEFRISAESMELFLSISAQAGSDPGETLLALRRHSTPIKEAAANSTYVGTMHGAKGREFDTVIIVGLNEGEFPIASKDADMEEEARLMFVAVTRARQKLVLMRWDKSPTQFSGIKEFPPSRFWLTAMEWSISQ